MREYYMLEVKKLTPKAGVIKKYLIVYEHETAGLVLYDKWDYEADALAKLRHLNKENQ